MTHAHGQKSHAVLVFWSHGFVLVSCGIFGLEPRLNVKSKPCSACQTRRFNWRRSERGRGTWGYIAGEARAAMNPPRVSPDGRADDSREWARHSADVDEVRHTKNQHSCTFLTLLMARVSQGVKVPLKVLVHQGDLAVRPTVGLLVRRDVTMEDILHKAFDFEDKHKLDEERVMRLLHCPVDVTLRSRDGEEFNVLVKTLVGDAWLWGAFNSVKFDLAVPTRKVTILQLPRAQQWTDTTSFLLFRCD